MTSKFKCGNCGSEDVQILLPTWFDPNDLTFIEADAEAEVLSVWCEECEESEFLISPDGWEVVGRWQ